eukprot:989629-Pyramimonas_sp.AAC.1
MVVSSSPTPHHPRHYLVDHRYGGTSGCSWIRSTAWKLAASLTHILHPGAITLLKSTHLVQLETL